MKKFLFGVLLLFSTNLFSQASADYFKQAGIKAYKKTITSKQSIILR